MTGLNCTSTPCWPGIRGSDLAGVTGIDDNVNSAEGDSVVIRLHSALRTNGMGINWRHGFDKSSNGGTTIAHTNASHVPGLQVPRMIYRLFDPATRTWSAFDRRRWTPTTFRSPARTRSWWETPIGWTGRPGTRPDSTFREASRSTGRAPTTTSLLPRGARLQYYFKAVDVAGTVAYQFQGEDAAYEVDDLPTSSAAPRRPRTSSNSTSFPVSTPWPGRNAARGPNQYPILNLDGAYTAWSFSQDPGDPGPRPRRPGRPPSAAAGAGLREQHRGARADRAAGQSEVGSADQPLPEHERVLDRDSTWYRILIQSSHLRNAALEDEADARLIEAWWNSPTGSNGEIAACSPRARITRTRSQCRRIDPSSPRSSYASNVLGIQSAAGAWAGSGSNLHPTVEDRFANPASGPGLVAGYTYPTDCGCPGPNRPDALTKVASPDAQNVAFYPLFSGVTDVAGVARMSEADPITDKDRSKALAYGFSVQYVRKTGIPTNASNYVHSGVEERMQVLYKFLTSCRGARTGASADSGKCWPCPTSVNLTELGECVRLPDEHLRTALPHPGPQSGDRRRTRTWRPQGR